MMDSLRTTANSLVLKVISDIITVPFVLIGVNGYLTGGGSNFAAKVSGQEISRGQFENAFNSERNRIQQQLGDQYSELATNEDYMETLRQQVLNRLVDETLLDQYSRELKFNISDDQVKQAIFTMPVFQVDGKFDSNCCSAIVNQTGMTTDQYAQALCNRLTTQQLTNGVAGMNFMLKGETDEPAALVAQQRIVREATIDVNALAAEQLVTERKVVSYYGQNKNNSITPEQFRVNYIKLDTTAMQETANDADIQSYYDQHQDQFTQPQCNHRSIIQTGTEDKAKAVLDGLNKGGDSAALVREEPAGITSARKGDDTEQPEDSTTLDELKNIGLKEKDQLSGIIKPSVGFLVARLDGVRPAQVKPLDEAHDEVAAKVRQEKALSAYYALQQEASDVASNSNESLVGTEQATGVKAAETGWSSHDNLPEELNSKPVADIILNGGLVGENGTSGGNSNVITMDGNHVFVLHIAEREAEAMKPPAEVREQVTVLAKHNKAEQQTKPDVGKLLADLKAGKGDGAMRAAGLNFGEAKTLSRTGQDPLSQATFGLSPPAKGKPSYGVASNMQGDAILLALDEVKADSMPRAQKKATVQGVAQNNVQIVFRALMNNLRGVTKIKIRGALEWR